MGEYFIKLYLTVRAKNEEEAEKIVDQIINAPLPEEVENSIISFSYDEIIQGIEPSH